MKKYSQGWIIVGWAALALSAMLAGIIAIYGVGEEGAHVTIRATARTSFVLFLTAFTATALVRLWPGRLTKWVRANRRYIGVSFGVSHGFHAIGIAALAFITSGASIRETDTSALVGGSLAYLFIAAMVFTSFDRTAAMLGQRKWQILHTTGM
jgi:methionine sulfoxide reductase heme-binding subunit